MEINEKYIATTGRVGTLDELSLGDDVTVTVSVVEISDKDRQDGTVDRTYKCKLFAPEEMGKKVGLKMGQSPSQRLRNVLYRYWEQQGEGDFNVFYEKHVDLFIEKIKEKLS